MKFLITGGCGFLGCNITRKLFDLDGSEISIIDDLSRQGSKENLNWLRTFGYFDFFKEDVTNYSKIEEIILDKKPDVILHLAGQVAMTTSLQNPIRDFDINARSTINILEILRIKLPDTKFLYSSTNKVYGDLEHLVYEETDTRYVLKDFPLGISESMRLEMSSPYGCSKGSADQYILDYSRCFDLKTIVFRHSSIFGSRQFSTYDQGWIGWFMKKAFESKNNDKNLVFEISGNGKQVRDILFSDDLVDLYLRAILSDTSKEAFNIGGGPSNSLSLIELFEFISKELDIDYEIKSGDWRTSDQKVFISDNSKVMDHLKWNPKTDLTNGLNEMMEWISEHSNAR